MIAGRNQRQFAQNVGQGDNIHHRFGWQIHNLGTDLGRAGPPIFRLSRAIIVQGLDKSTLALLDLVCVGADSHLENQVDTAIPALLNGRTECGERSVIVRRRRNEKNEVLGASNQNVISEYYDIQINTYGYTGMPAYTYRYMQIFTYTE